MRIDVAVALLVDWTPAVCNSCAHAPQIEPTIIRAYWCGASDRLKCCPEKCMNGKAKNICPNACTKTTCPGGILALVPRMRTNKNDKPPTIEAPMPHITPVWFNDKTFDESNRNDGLLTNVAPVGKKRERNLSQIPRQAAHGRVATSTMPREWRNDHVRQNSSSANLQVGRQRRMGIVCVEREGGTC